VNELVYSQDSIGKASYARRWLDRLREMLRAADALVWVIREGKARVALRAGGTGGEPGATDFSVDTRDVAIGRLRRNGIVFCNAGEVADLQDFVSAGTGSFVAAGANDGGSLSSVLVLGWATPSPPFCEAASLAHLRIAAALLDRAAAEGSPEALSQPTVDELTRGPGDRRFARIADALPIQFWIADPDGRVTCASRDWENSVGDTPGASNRLRQWIDPVHPLDRDRAAAAFDAAVAGRDRLELELRMRTADGTYRWSACAMAPLCTAEGIVDGYVGVSVDVSARRQAESALEAMATRFLAAQEAQRSRIARDLHDDLGHQLVLLDAAVEAALCQHASPAGLQSTLRDVRGKLQQLAISIHELSHSLHPAKLKLLGLAPTLQALCRDIAAEAQWDVRFEATPVPRDIDEDAALCIFRVAQEALQNAVKHSHAQTIGVQLIAADGQLRLRIGDDGGGFDPLVAPSAGLGLLTMRERVELLGGTLAVHTAPTRGTTIEVAVSMKQRGTA
jgi:PAS domain S-box-containing protein